MELKEFIKDIVLEIVEGVSIAQNELNSRKIKAIVNPTRDQHNGSSLIGNVFDYYETSKIEIEASIVSSKEGGVGASIKVLSGDMKNKTENSSRVKFSVPILLPPPVLPSDFID